MTARFQEAYENKIWQHLSKSAVIENIVLAALAVIS